MTFYNAIFLSLKIIMKKNDQRFKSFYKVFFKLLLMGFTNMINEIGQNVFRISLELIIPIFFHLGSTSKICHRPLFSMTEVSRLEKKILTLS